MFIYIPYPITLFLAISVLLFATACTPENVRYGETSTIANESSGSEKVVAMEQTAEPVETEFQNTVSSVVDKSQGEDSKVQMVAPVDKPKPLVASVESKANLKPKPQVVTKPKVKTKKPSHAAATKKPVTAPAPEKKPDVKITLQVASDPAQSRGPSTRPEEKGKEVVVQPAEKTTIGLDAADSETEAAEELASMDGQQELAMLTRQTNLSEEASPDIPTLETVPLDLAALPLSFGSHWSLDRRPNPIDHKTQCLLESRSVNISDGYDRTDVQLLLTANSLYVKTESNLDLSYPDTGMRLDNGALVPFEGLAKETAAMISGDVALLYEQMAPSRTVLVRLGFWPTWPVTKTQEASFPLDGFEHAIKALWLCEKM